MHKVWLYAPGENASKWDVCLSQNIMCIGWDEMGNLLEYASKKEMAARLQEIYDKPEASFKNDSLALWEFAHEMQAGDIVIVKKGQNQIIGRGIVEGDYAFDESFSDFKNVRKMQWTNAGEWENITIGNEDLTSIFLLLDITLRSICLDASSNSVSDTTFSSEFK